MSIQGLANTAACTENRPAAARQSAASRASFQEQLDKTAAGGTSRLCTGGSAAPSDGAAETSLPDTLDAARLLLLQRTREGREWKKEQDEWDRLMKGLDSWIEALRDAADRRRKDGRSGGVTAEGGEALMALYRGYIAAFAWAEAAEDPVQAKADLLDALTMAQDALLERLREDKIAEEERREWEDLLKRLDRLIERLRAERGDEDRRVAYGASAVGVQTSADAWQ